jgi:hypothetical protein
MRASTTVFVLALLTPAALSSWSTLPAQVAIRDTAEPAKRIWAPTMAEHQEAWFRRTLEFAKPAQQPRLYFSCDNECTVFVNGREVGTCKDHQHLTIVRLDEPLKGKVTIAVHAKNTGSCAAMSLWLLWDEPDGQHEMHTDEAWRVTTTAVAKWNEPTFDDRAWDAAVPNFDTKFGLNLYNGPPAAVHVVDAMSPSIDPIARALDELRSAADRDAALKALDKIERAVMEARNKLWQKPPAAPAGAPAGR